MKDLDRKYRENKLTIDELHQLREQINSASDEEIADTMLDVWMNDTIDTSDLSDTRMEAIKANIDKQLADIPAQKTDWTKWMTKISAIAAAVLLPIFILTTFYLYKENANLSTDAMVVATGKGEHATIVLPDGTRVTLNSDSRLSYIPHLYNKDQRNIDFNGEAYFQVSKDKERPFTIQAQGLQITVLGTTFNLDARDAQQSASLTLEEGKVSFFSTLLQKDIIVEPNQKAVLNRKDGNITVTRTDAPSNDSAWLRGELIFRNVTFDELLKVLENNYDVRIQTSHLKIDQTDLFTGTITAQDINEALEIIEKTFGLTATLQGKQVLLVANK